MKAGYACRVCGFSENNTAIWCALGCGSDYNEMISTVGLAFRHMRIDERDQFITQGLEDIIAGAHLRGCDGECGPDYETGHKSPGGQEDCHAEIAMRLLGEIDYEVQASHEASTEPEPK